MGKYRFIQGLIMGLFDKLKTVLGEDLPQVGKVKVKKITGAKKPADPPAPKPKKSRAKPTEVPKSKKVLELKNLTKDKATKAGEPYVEVLSMDIDPVDPTNGAFELDWNDIFVARLVKAGYQGKTDADIVDNWFKAVCRNVVMETYEQDQADPTNRTNRRDLGNGRTEIS